MRSRYGVNANSLPSTSSRGNNLSPWRFVFRNKSAFRSVQFSSSLQAKYHYQSVLLVMAGFHPSFDGTSHIFFVASVSIPTSIYLLYGRYRLVRTSAYVYGGWSRTALSVYSYSSFASILAQLILNDPTFLFTYGLCFVTSRVSCGARKGFILCFSFLICKTLGLGRPGR